MATTAETSVEVAVKVSFRLVNPLDISCFAVRVGDDGFANGAHVVSAEGDAVRCSRAHLRVPSSPPKVVGILPRGDGGSEGYVVAAIIPKCIDHVFKYQLFLYSPNTNAWCTKVIPLHCDCEDDLSSAWNHGTTKAIAVGGNSLGWVDLWRGILVCNVLIEEDPVVRFIQLPGPIPGNKREFETSSPRTFRDVICIGDSIKFVEVDYHQDNDGADHGWKATSWNMMLSSKDWHECFTVDTGDIPVTDETCSRLLPELRDDKAKELSLNRLICSAPTLSMDDDVFYMTSKLRRNPVEWLASVNMRENAMELAPYTAGKMFSGGTFPSDPTYRPCAFSNYLNQPT